MIWNANEECPLCSAQSAVGWVGGPINTRNGNVSYQETDLVIPVSGGSLSFRRAYASQATAVYTTTLGYGWSHNYEMRLHWDNNVLPDTVELQAPGGSRLPFFDNGNGSFTPYPGVTAALTYNSGNGQYVVTGFNQATYIFDGLGQLVEQIDPFGNSIDFSYANGRLIQASQGNRYLTYSYDETSGRLLTVSDNLDRTVTMLYDENGDLNGVVNPLTLTTTYAYSGTTHLLTEVTDPSGRVIEETAYDSDGRAYQQWDGGGNLLVEIDYSLENRRVVIENGVIVTHTYDLRGTLVDVTYACADGTAGCGAGTGAGFDYNFKHNAVTDANGNPTALSWNSGGSTLEYVSDALDNETSLTYDKYNSLTQVVNARDVPTIYRYENEAFPTFRTSMTDGAGQTTIYTPTTMADGIPGLLKEEQDPNGNVTYYMYNEYGQVRAIIYGYGTSAARTTAYEYDSVGRLILTTQSGDEASQSTLYVYDNGDRLMATIVNWTGRQPQAWQNDCVIPAPDADQDICTLYRYDAAGRTISTTNALDQTNLTFYDPAGRVYLSITNYQGSGDPFAVPDPVAAFCDFANPDPEFNLCALTGYDEFGRVETSTDSLGRVTRTFYDSLGRVAGSINNQVNVTSLDSCSFPPTVTDQDLCTLYEYDAIGNTIIVTDAMGQMTRTFYDPLNRVAGSIANWSRAIDDSADLPTCLALPAERDSDVCTLYEYDEVGNTIIVTDTLGRMTRTFYDEINRVAASVANWNPAALADPAGCILSPDNENVENVCTLYGYDDAGNQVTTTNALDQTSLTVYDAANRPFLTVQNWDGALIESENDCSFPPAQPDINLCSVTYFDSLGRRSASKDPLGNLTEFAYDGLGRLITTTRFNGQWPIVTHQSYDALGNRLNQTDANDHTTTFVYDSLNRLQTTISHEGVAITQTYNAAGWLLATTNGLDHQTVNTYDQLGRLVRVTDAEDNGTEYQYDALGRQTAVIDAENVTTSYLYDGLGRLVGVIENDTGGLPNNDSNVLTQYVYNAIGNRLVITNALGYTATLTVYDALNRPIVVEDALGNQTITQYNALGYRTVMTDANDAVTNFSYDGLNRLVETNYLADAETVSYSYDALGNRLAMSDALGISSYAYDDLSRLITVTSPLTGTVVYGYDDVGNRTSLRYPDTKQVTYTYDGDNRLVMVEDWAEGMTEYEYDAAGRLITTTLPNGVITTNQYDDANRLIGLSHRDDNGRILSAYEYLLDGVGNRLVATETLRLPVPETVVLQPGPEVGIDTDIDQSYPNSSYGGASTARIGTRFGPGSSYPGGPYRSLLQFDLSAIPVGTAVESATLEVYAYQYEGTNTFRLYRATSAWDESATWNTQPSYDASTLWGSFSTSTYRQYVKRATDVSAIATQWVDGVYPNYGLYIKGANESSWTRHWFYTSDGADLVMRPKLIVTLADTLATTTIQYSYDPLYRLTAANYTGNVVTDFNYEYDAVGNMTVYTEQVNGQKTGVTRVFNAANQLVSSHDGSETTIYTYDNNGNLFETRALASGPTIYYYTYDQRNLLTRIAKQVGRGPMQPIAAYFYDGHGDRVRQTDHITGMTVTYTNDVLGLTQVLVSDDGATTTYNLFGLDLIHQDDGTQMRFLLADGLGSVRQEMADGDLQTTTTYEPYGKLLARTGTSGTVYGFTGEQEDAATGLLYLRARYYNPALKVFLSRDPFPGASSTPATRHGYSYAHNNPVNLTDPTGYCVPGQCEAWVEQWSPSNPQWWKPEGRVYVEGYGVFDISHIARGYRSAQFFMGEIERTLAKGGGVFENPAFSEGGRLRGNYEVYYWVSGNVTTNQITGLAYGMYMDFELGYERLQADRIDFYSAFAPEDLPSDHLGFWAYVNGKAYNEIPGALARLGEVTPWYFGSLLVDIMVGGQTWTPGITSGITILCFPRNYEFLPMVDTIYYHGYGAYETRWQNRPWPEWLELTPIPSGPDTWHRIN